MTDGGDLPYCTGCGQRLQEASNYCTKCGTARFAPSAPPGSPRPERRVGPRPLAAPTAAPTTAQTVRALSWFFALGGVLLMIWDTSALAVVSSPVGQRQLRQIAPAASQDPVLVAGMLVTLVAMLALLHAVAFHGLRAGRRGGWFSAVVLAALWSAALVGIPVLWRLLQPPVRALFWKSGAVER